MSADPDLPAPDGPYVLKRWAWEVRMSHWIVGSALLDVRSGAAFWSTPAQWSLLQAHWESAERIRLQLSRYPDGAVLALLIDCARGLVQQDGSWCSMAEAARALDEGGRDRLADITR